MIKSIYIAFLIAASILVTANSFFAQERNSQADKNAAEITAEQGRYLDTSDNNDNIIFQCQVDLEVLSSQPRRCSKCGLTLKRFTMDEVMDNLVAHGFIKPKLKNKNVLRVEEEAADTLAEETADTLMAGIEIPEIDFAALDHDENGDVYQCPNCPQEVADDQFRCRICDELFQEYTIEEAESNLRALATGTAETPLEADENSKMKDKEK